MKNSSANNAFPASLSTDELQQLKALGFYVGYLSLMAIQRAKSGHPGLPLGCARLGLLLYRYFLNFNPKAPTWLGRDRFFLSAGHGSMLLYALNYLFGYPLSLKEIANFRQLGSATPGHPEFSLSHGIETTTGPLGQGFANAVGAALEAKHLSAKTSSSPFPLFASQVFTLLGDGCIMEGVTNEAASLAGHLGLDNLIAIYDANQISIDGDTALTLSEAVGDKFAALGFQVAQAKLTDLQQVYQLLVNFKTNPGGKPKLLVLKTVIGEGLDKMQGKAAAHGQPPGLNELLYFVAHVPWLAELLTSQHQGKSLEAILVTQLQTGHFLPKAAVIEKLRAHSFFSAQSREENYSKWQAAYANFSASAAPQAKALRQILAPLDSSSLAPLEKALLNYRTPNPGAASRTLSGEVLQLVASHTQKMLGGSADLVSSTKATVKGEPYLHKQAFAARNIAFGVREHAMAALGNGLALNKVLLPFTSTFLVFLDYLKPAVRLAALMQLPHLFIFTHDSFYVGEDGPTHQPIEHLGSLRLIPNLVTFRPANDLEMALAYLFFLKEKRPVAILASRQNLEKALFNPQPDLPSQAANCYLQHFSKGAYLFKAEAPSAPLDLVLAGSGSELGALWRLKKRLADKGKNCRLVSMPCMELLAQAGQAYFEDLFTKTTPVYFVEASSHRSFSQLYDERFLVKQIANFGCSAPGETVAAVNGFDDESLFQEVNKHFFASAL